MKIDLSVNLREPNQDGTFSPVSVLVSNALAAAPSPDPADAADISDMVRGGAQDFSSGQLKQMENALVYLSGKGISNLTLGQALKIVRSAK